MKKMTHEESELIESLRKLRPAKQLLSHEASTPGERVADAVTLKVGSWRFLIFQSVALLAWLFFNSVLPHAWDPYPFILLNLVLSFQAAYTAPVLLMSQNREARIERAKLEYYYKINLKQEVEIELLHAKIDKQDIEIDLLHKKIDRLLLEREAN